MSEFVCITLPADDLAPNSARASAGRVVTKVEAEWPYMHQLLTIIRSDNGLSPSRHQAIIWTNAGILLIWF